MHNRIKHEKQPKTQQKNRSTLALKNKKNKRWQWFGGALDDGEHGLVMGTILGHEERRHRRRHPKRLTCLCGQGKQNSGARGEKGSHKTSHEDSRMPPPRIICGALGANRGPSRVWKGPRGELEGTAMPCSSDTSTRPLPHLLGQEGCKTSGAIPGG